uniref:Uncharacterized protein n=1 Tax=Trichogramma kaykai TaxID=54128 RepID=A0ABD2VYX7_9HYME
MERLATCSAVFCSEALLSREKESREKCVVRGERQRLVHNARYKRFLFKSESIFSIYELINNSSLKKKVKNKKAFLYQTTTAIRSLISPGLEVIFFGSCLIFLVRGGQCAQRRCRSSRNWLGGIVPSSEYCPDFREDSAVNQSKKSIKREKTFTSCVIICCRTLTLLYTVARTRINFVCVYAYDQCTRSNCFISPVIMATSSNRQIHYSTATVHVRMYELSIISIGQEEKGYELYSFRIINLSLGEQVKVIMIIERVERSM